MLFQAPTSDLLTLIPLSARTIAVVGSATGNLTAAFQRINPKAQVIEVDVDAVECKLAGRRTDPNDPGGRPGEALSLSVPGSIDCIIFTGIPHHLLDPWPLIQRHAEALRPDGTMLICVPNADNRPLAGCPLRDARHDGPTAGGPERSRLFSLETVRENVARAGLTLCDVVSNVAPGGPGTLAPGPEAINADPQDCFKSSAGHAIWRLRKEPRKRLIVCGSMLDPVGGVSHLRVVYPLRAIATDPTVTAHVTDRVSNDPPSDDAARIFVLHRPTLFGQEGQQLLRRLTNAGFLIVTEFDDLPGHFKMMQLGGELSFYGVHAIQTSTTVMAEELRRYNAEIAVFPNAAPVLPEISNFIDTKAMTLFFGALNREKDWLPFMPAINAVAALAGERLNFTVVHDQSFFDALETPHKSFTPTCDHETYLRLLGRSEICFMPLSDTAFNRAKSDLKFVEAGSCRVAALASSVVYGDSIRDGHNGMLFRDSTELHVRLLRLIAMHEATRDLADAARRYVSDERMLAYQVSARIGWYRSLWARRAALGAARQERLLHNGATA